MALGRSEVTDRGVSHHTPVCVPARCVPLLLAPPALSAITRMFIISVHCGARTHLERSQENSPLEGVSDHERAHGWKKKEDLALAVRLSGALSGVR